MNARLIESRNKREGEYAGKSGYCRYGGTLGRLRHRREGGMDIVIYISLKEWARRAKW